MGRDAGLRSRRHAVTDRAGRSWGYWTQAKLSVLADYLDAFIRASSGPSERVYLDAFAGEGSGLDRLTGEEFKGSAHRAGGRRARVHARSLLRERAACG